MSGCPDPRYMSAVEAIRQAIAKTLPFDEVQQLPEVVVAVEAGVLDFELIKQAWM